jgi:Ran GTPase-activating protein (RanGAP) involved in mRNA processing and transport
LEYLSCEGKNQPLRLTHNFKPKDIQKLNKKVWPQFLHLA